MSALFPLVTALTIASSLKAEGQVVEMDMRGAVLCSYSLSVGFKAISSQCRPRNAQLQELFSWSIDQHRSFVLRNSEMTDAEVADFEIQHADLKGRTCENLASDQWLLMLDALASAPEEFIKEIEYSLAVDRTPVWNPCL